MRPGPATGRSSTWPRPPPLRPFLVAALAADAPDGAGRPVLAVTATGREAEDLADALGCLLPPRHGRRVPGLGDAAARAALARARTPSAAGSRCCAGWPTPDDAGGDGPVGVVVAPVRSLLQPQVAGPRRPRAGRAARRRRAPSSRTSVRRLAAAAYTRVDLVERRGEFAVRGGILDVFPPTEEHPVRVEFWGDKVEEMRWFTVADQRSLEIAERRPVGAAVPRAAARRRRPRARAAELAVEHPGLADMLDKLAEGIAVEGMESLAPVLVDRMELLTDVLPAGTHVVLCDPERVRTRAHDLVATGEEFLEASWAAAAAGGSDPDRPGLRAPYRSLADVRDHARRAGAAWWTRHAVRCPTCELDAGRRDTLVVRARARRSRTAATPSARSTTSASWLRRRLAGRAWSPRATARPSASLERAARGRHRRPAGRRRWTPSRSRRSCTSRPASLEHGFVARRRSASRCSPRPTSPASAAVHQGHAPAAEPPPARRRPAAAAAPATTSCTSSTASAATSRWCSAPSAGRDPRVPGARVRARPSAASPATGCTCRPTSSTR